jgi:hypothetical protein
LGQIEQTDELVIPVARAVIKTILRQGLANAGKTWAKKIKDGRKNNNGQNQKEQAKSPSKR